MNPKVAMMLEGGERRSDSECGKERQCREASYMEGHSVLAGGGGKERTEGEETRPRRD